MKKDLLKKILFAILRIIAILVISFVIILIVVSFPIFVYFCVWLFSQMINNLPLQFEMQMGDSFSLTIDSYSTLIISLLSFLATTVLAWLTYRLTVKIDNRTLSVENNTNRIILNNIKREIMYNVEIIENIANNVCSDYHKIEVQYKNDLSTVSIIFSDEEYTQLCEIYNFFVACKKNKKVNKKMMVKTENAYTIDKTKLLQILDMKIKEIKHEC